MSEAYLAHNGWPVWHYVQSELDRDGLEADTLIRSLPRVGSVNSIGPSYGIAWFDDRMLREDSRPALTVAAGAHVGDLYSDFAEPFIRVLKLLVDWYANFPVSPHEVTQVSVTADDLAQSLPVLSKGGLLRLPEILNHEPPTRGSGSVDQADPTKWTRYLNRYILQYRGIYTLEDYLDRVKELHPDPGVQVGHEHAVFQIASSIETTSPAAPVSPAPETLYIKASLASELEKKAAGSVAWNLDKLVRLVSELNENYARGQAYASHALLRAILDHTPPVFGMKSFDEVVDNYKWGQTDKKYLKALKSFRAAADDVLHRQIRKGADVIGIEDMPQSAYVNAFIRGLVDIL